MLAILSFHCIGVNCLDCEQSDSRGVVWNGKPYERVKKSCAEGGFHDLQFIDGKIIKLAVLICHSIMHVACF